jgi:hypothetical protein
MLVLVPSVSISSSPFHPKVIFVFLTFTANKPLYAHRSLIRAKTVIYILQHSSRDFSSNLRLTELDLGVTEMTKMQRRSGGGKLFLRRDVC